MVFNGYIILRATLVAFEEYQNYCQRVPWSPACLATLSTVGLLLFLVGVPLNLSSMFLKWLMLAACFTLLGRAL